MDYLVWICREMRQLGFHSGSEREEWCRRCQAAYNAFCMPMLPGYGDPYPPDVPPARNPGIWPDIPAATIPGMTLRHQLTVLEMLSRQLRERSWPHARATEIAGWDERLGRAITALDHGDTMPMPKEAATQPSAEALAAAEASDKALRDATRRRNKQLRNQFQPKASPPKKKPKKAAVAEVEAVSEAASGKTGKSKAPKKNAATKKKAATKKAATKKKAAPKKKAAARKK
ncbi:MAG: hypothetical protein O2894_00545 [Planctomycetota bacterium]|nr:hypothetical protein [Planctomycetota bacterium]